jgi:hypothetical protein
MPARDPAVRAITSKIGAARRHHPGTDTSELERDLHAARLEDHVRRVVNDLPPLTDDQRNRLALPLQGGEAP